MMGVFDFSGVHFRDAVERGGVTPILASGITRRSCSVVVDSLFDQITAEVADRNGPTRPAAAIAHCDYSATKVDSVSELFFCPLRVLGGGEALGAAQVVLNSREANEDTFLGTS